MQTSTSTHRLRVQKKRNFRGTNPVCRKTEGQYNPPCGTMRDIDSKRVVH